MHNYIFDAATNGLLLQAEEINPVACKEPRPVYAGEHVLRAKIEESKDNNCPLFR